MKTSLIGNFDIDYSYWFFSIDEFVSFGSLVSKLIPFFSFGFFSIISHHLISCKLYRCNLDVIIFLRKFFLQYLFVALKSLRVSSLFWNLTFSFSWTFDNNNPAALCLIFIHNNGVFTWSIQLDFTFLTNYRRLLWRNERRFILSHNSWAKKASVTLRGILARMLTNMSLFVLNLINWLIWLIVGGIHQRRMGPYF